MAQITRSKLSTLLAVVLSLALLSLCCLGCVKKNKQTTIQETTMSNKNKQETAAETTQDVTITLLQPSMVPGNITKSLAEIIHNESPYKFDLLRSTESEDYYIMKYDIDYSKIDIPNCTVVVDTLLRTFDKKNNTALVNIIRVRATPHIKPITSVAAKKRFTEFSTEWHNTNLVPQGLYTDDEGNVVLSWDIPVTANAPVFPHQVSYAVAALIESWGTMGTAMKEAGIIK
ncbi:hypothetical protein [Halodesulfovibrio marinisediminis]|uniref:Uncharacterized protein n=1 Tax=Halodesulfovibrio marinisediminis DSM 17456 TaxID=1121457 RepID=A0A1N6FUE7_9BACT|nr:hypothetical protein [Halodesulfovibrio marinisediminis]SIN98791.1 hypothetical protein SAMN02745161_1515 [Halodesulfovibrio marinisediminis DSM 17456]